MPEDHAKARRAVAPHRFLVPVLDLLIPRNIEVTKLLRQLETARIIGCPGQSLCLRPHSAEAELDRRTFEWRLLGQNC